MRVALDAYPPAEAAPDRRPARAVMSSMRMPCASNDSLPVDVLQAVRQRQVTDASVRDRRVAGEDRRVERTLDLRVE